MKSKVTIEKGQRGTNGITFPSSGTIFITDPELTSLKSLLVGWKKCSEVRPPENKYILLYMQIKRDDGGEYKGIFQGVYESPLFYSDYKNGIRVAFSGVTHWSELPPLPEIER